MSIIKKINEFEIAGLKTSKLVSNGSGNIILIGIEKGAVLKEHVSNTDATIYVIEGEVKFSIHQQEYILKTGELYTFLKEEIHELEGIKNSKVLLIK